MILRRVAEHVRVQNWTAVAIDFVIVVVGVFIGLQVQEWSKKQSDRRQEMQIIADLLADLKIDRSQYVNGLTLAAGRIAAANESLRGAGLAPVEFHWEMPETEFFKYSFDMSKVARIPAAEHDRLWTGVVLGAFSYPSMTTYDAIIGSGDIRIIRDRDLVRELQAYRTLADYFRMIATEPDLAAAIRTQASFAFFHYGEFKSADDGAAELQDRLTRYLAERD